MNTYKVRHANLPTGTSSLEVQADGYFFENEHPIVTFAVRRRDTSEGRVTSLPVAGLLSIEEIAGIRDSQEQVAA